MGVTISAAVVGCGRMGAFTSPSVRDQAPACWFPLAHAEAIAAHPALTLAAVTDHDREAAERAAAFYRAGQSFADPEEMLHVVRPQLVAIATRTMGRADIALSAMRNGASGLHLEKPLCNSMAELDRLSLALRQSAAHATFGAIRRHLAPYRAALTFVQAGALGALTEVQVNLGRAPLYWTHPHAIDLILAAAGGDRVADISARLLHCEEGEHRAHIRNDPLVETATIRFESGLVGRIGQMPGSDLLLCCEGGAVAVEADGHRTRILRRDDDDAYARWRDIMLPVAEQPGGTLAAITELVDAMEGKESARSVNQRSISDMLMGQHLLFAIAQSHVEGGRPIAAADVDPAWRIDGFTGGRPA